VKTLGPRIRTRDTQIPAGGSVKAGSIYNIANGYPAPLLAQDVYTPYQNRTSSRETVWDSVNPGPPYVTGGAFKKLQVGFPYIDLRDAGQYYLDPGTKNPWTGETWFYQGAFFGPAWYPYLDEFSDDSLLGIASGEPNLTLVPDLSSLGAGAYSRLRPKPELADMGVFLAEIRDANGMLQGPVSYVAHKATRLKGNLPAASEAFANYWKRVGGNLKSTNMLPKHIAGEFVNTQFGWAPFISDLQKLNNATLNAQKHFAQLERDNAQWVKRIRADRRIESEEVVWTQSNPGCSPMSYNGADFYQPGASYTIKLQKFTDVWYEGVFKSYRPEFDISKDYGNFTIVRDIDRHLTLLGLQVNPMLIWRAYPWTWAVDWFVKVGDNIQLFQDLATDSVASKYMYLMHHSMYRFELNSKFTTWDGKKHDIVWYRYFESKRREGADSSFNFRLANPLSGRQLAILAALGLSHR